MDKNEIVYAVKWDGFGSFDSAFRVVLETGKKVFDDRDEAIQFIKELILHGSGLKNIRCEIMSLQFEESLDILDFTGIGKMIKMK